MIYDKIQPAYDRKHARFLAWSGSAAQSALEAAVLALLQPCMLILDAGCGTGLMARRLLTVATSNQMVLLDQSPSMLSSSRDLPARRIYGSLLALPFADASFDLTIAAWSIEATSNPATAIHELARVTKSGGIIGSVFCCAERGDLIDRLYHSLIRIRGLGQPLFLKSVLSDLRMNGVSEVRQLPAPGGAAALIAWKGA